MLAWITAGAVLIVALGCLAIVAFRLLVTFGDIVLWEDGDDVD
jgi:hypothetical protein